MSEQGISFRIERGWHSTVIIFPSLRIAIKVFREGLLKNAEKEYSLLLRLYNKGLNVPKPYVLIRDSKKPILIREFIDGRFFHDFLKLASVVEVREVVISLVKLSYLLDNENIFLNELSRATRNIIVTSSLKPYIIDLERANISKRSNVTQFLSYLYRLALSTAKFAWKIRAILRVDEIIDVCKLYKKRKDFNAVLRCFKN